MSSFADALVTQKSKGSHKLEKIEALIDWTPFKKKLKIILDRSGMGPKGYDPLKMFKAMILQHMYGLSDPGMEEMLYDRFSFRRFCGFGLSDSLPDETTLCRFRGALAGHEQDLLDLVWVCLERRGLKVEKGTIVDATVFASRAARPQGGCVSETDPQAGWTRKGGKYHHGYKAHMSTDATYGLFKSTYVTGADVHDSLVFGVLLGPDDGDVYADKAYGSQKNRRLLRENNLGDRLLFKAKRGKALTSAQRLMNRLMNQTRVTIERSFAHIKQSPTMVRSSYFGITANQIAIGLKAIAYNLTRAYKILET